MVYYVEDDTNIREITLYALTQAGIDAKGFSNDASFRRACDERVPMLFSLTLCFPTPMAFLFAAHSPDSWFDGCARHDAYRKRY